MPTTRKRSWCIPLAIRCFQKQTYDRRSELVIVTEDGDLGVDLATFPPHPPLHLAQVRGRPTMGEKYNLGVELARYDWIVPWDDDDWHAPWRLLEIAKRIGNGINVVADWTLVYHELHEKRRTLLYTYDQPGRYLIHGSMAYSKDLWQQVGGYGRVNAGTSDYLVTGMVEKGCSLARLDPQTPIYVAFSHPGSTSNSRLPENDRLFTPWPGSVRALMGGDLERYEAACPTGR